MAIKFVCDGCDEGCDRTALIELGELAKVIYCKDCQRHYEAFEAAETQARLDAIALFESQRALALAEAKTRLKVLPDE